MASDGGQYGFACNEYFINEERRRLTYFFDLQFIPFLI